MCPHQTARSHTPPVILNVGPTTNMNQDKIIEALDGLNLGIFMSSSVSIKEFENKIIIEPTPINLMIASLWMSFVVIVINIIAFKLKRNEFNEILIMSIISSAMFCIVVWGIEKIRKESGPYSEITNEVRLGSTIINFDKVDGLYDVYFKRAKGKNRHVRVVLLEINNKLYPILYQITMLHKWVKPKLSILETKFNVSVNVMYLDYVHSESGPTR